MKEALINLHFCRLCVLTCAEFEQLDREVKAFALLDPDSIMARVCVTLWRDNLYRYHEAREQNSGKA